MSALGGVCYFDGRPVSDREMAMLRDCLTSRGPDGGWEVRSGSVGVAYRAFHTNRESRLERQPLMSTGGTILAWDGRLDNRAELLRLLHRDVRDSRTDAAIVMAAYRKWGVNCPTRLIGDFALSVCEPSTGTVLLARDPFGVRTLYYWLRGDRIARAATIFTQRNA